MSAAPVPVRLPLRVDVDARVEELLRNVPGGCERRPGENYNQSNKRHAEEFFEYVRREFPGRCQAQRQPISLLYLRTTDANYIYTVPGRSPEELVLVAHFDTWRGPGADDNTTGEEILKQYLLTDLRRAEPPPLTHTYVFAGSEECGLVGFLSQLLLSAGLVAANLAWTANSWIAALVALLGLPMAKYRFGVAGSRVYVKSLSPEQLARTKAVVAVDSVGEGKLYIPRETLGADFVRAFIPFEGYGRLNDLLEEAAHLHGIRYNSFLSGGTTDHVSWLEVNNGLPDRLWERLGGRPKPKVPAAALIAMKPGKASPLVFGGKIHTPNDTPDRIYPEPLRETLQVLDYFFHVMEGGPPPREPRRPEECHYARLYDFNGSCLLAMKDAVEPNRRNINMLYRAEAQVADGSARVEVKEPLGWGVHTELDREVRDLPDAWRRVRVESLEVVTEDGGSLRYARGIGPWQRGRSFWHRAIGKMEEWMGRYNFATFFLAAYVVAFTANRIMDYVFLHSEWFSVWYFRWVAATIPATVLVEFAVLTYLYAIRIPTWIDNSYKRLNRADNLASLRRVR